MLTVLQTFNLELQTLHFTICSTIVARCVLCRDVGNVLRLFNDNKKNLKTNKKKNSDLKH